jgi:hypothetical protein
MTSTPSTDSLAAQLNATEGIDDLLNIDRIDVIQTVIGSLDPNDTAMVSKGKSGTVWKFIYGSVEVFVQLTGDTDDDTLTAWAEILPLPVKDPQGLMLKLLQFNWADTLEAKYAISDNRVVVVANRTVADLSPGEISRTITLVANIADSNDDALKAEFSVN